MGVVVNDCEFATFDLVKELKTARNCLHAKHHILSTSNSSVEITECIQEGCMLVDDSQEESSDIEMLKICKSLEKRKVRKREFNYPQEGGSKTRKILACWIPGTFRFL